MRLIHTRTLEVEEFGANDVPRYAILSHTWGVEEVTLQDMNTEDVFNLLGYDKVRNASNIAAADDFDYIWIDTCCIDKSSSAELSEALNSMYRWYEEAEECYAYLADVPPGAINGQSSTAGDEFRKSKWFTRGWTLQELIAPSTVIFLDREWKAIGDKSSLQQLISEITGIPGGFLLGDDLEHASIAQRMSWASRRETTRIEDLAYSLMGIFGICMPMLYGEGDRAFIRLQEEIMKVSNDHSLFAWKSTEEHGGILATSPSVFADSGNIIRKSAFNAMSSPLTVTSRGIRLSLGFKYGQHGSGLAILDCAEVGKESMRLAIHLRDISLTGEDFTREKSSSLETLHLRDIDLSEYPQKDLYVRQWRSARNRKWGDMEKYAVKLEGVDGQEVASHIIHLHSNWELHDGLVATIKAPTSDGIIGRVLIVCKDGTSFQVLLKKYGRSLSADIQTSLNADSELDQIPLIPNQEQHERIQLFRKLDTGQHVQIAITKRILMLHKKKYLTGVVEINYSSTLLGTWIADIAVLEGDIKNTTLLSYAAGQGHRAVVSLLLDSNKVDIDSKDSESLTPLHWAARGGHATVVELFLENSILNTNSKDKNGWTPLLWAAQNGHAKVVKLLLEALASREAKDEKSDRTALSWVRRYRHKILPVWGAGLETKDNKFGQTPLLLAAEKGHAAVVQLLLEVGAEIEDKNEDGGTPLLRAAENGHEDVISLLLEAGADKEAKNNINCRTSLLEAAENGHRAAVRLLLEANADKEAKDLYKRTPLLIAAKNGHEDVVKLLLEAHADREVRDKRVNQTPLSWAAGNGHGAVVKLLLEADANTETRDLFGQTPLFRSAEKGREAVVKLLLEAKANKESKDVTGQTPLLKAAEKGRSAVVKLLLEANADKEAKDRYGRTALLWAAMNGHKMDVMSLLEVGADKDAKDEYGRTPLLWATKNEHKAIIQLLTNS